MNTPDDFSQYHAELLDGIYDCVDRIVLNAFFPLGQAGGGRGRHAVQVVKSVDARNYDLTVFKVKWGNLTPKIYDKGGRPVPRYGASSARGVSGRRRL